MPTGHEPLGGGDSARASHGGRGLDAVARETTGAHSPHPSGSHAPQSTQPVARVDHHLRPPPPPDPSHSSGFQCLAHCSLHWPNQALDPEVTLPALASHGEAMAPLPALASHGEAMPLAVRYPSHSRPLVRMRPHFWLLERCAAVATLSCALAPTGWQAAVRLTWARQRQECAAALPRLSSRLCLWVGALPDLDPPLPSPDRPRRLKATDRIDCRLSSTPLTPHRPGARRASPGSLEATPPRIVASVAREVALAQARPPAFLC